MPIRFICIASRSILISTTAVVLGASMAQTKLDETQAKVDSIKPTEWTGSLAPSMGSASAPIKVIFFVDYQCNACRTTDPLVRGAVSKRTDVALIYREFPLLMHPLAKPAAIVAANARVHGDFNLAHRRLMDGKELTMKSIKDAARMAGVSTNESAQAAQLIASDHSLVERVKINFVPSFVVIENGKSKLMNKAQVLDFLK